MPTPFRVVLLLAVLLPGRMMDAQAHRPVRFGERVRVATTAGPNSMVTGVVAGFRAETLEVRIFADSIVRVAFADIRQLEASGGARDRIGVQNMAAVAGGAIGLVLGAVVGVSAVQSPSNDLRQFFAGIIGGSVGLLVGIGTGYAAAMDVEAERWHVVAIPEPGRDVVASAAPDSTPPVAALDERRSALLPPGVRVLVQRVADAPDVIGTVAALGDTLRVRQDDGAVIGVPWPAVQQVFRSKGRPSTSRRLGETALIGMAIGALVGLNAAPSLGLVSSEVDCVSVVACGPVAIAVGGGAALGMVVGAMFGGSPRAEEWVLVRGVVTPD